MRINNNIAAMNTHMQLSISGSKKAKSTEKLSSGLRINRSADDAAGLAISEKMRAQIRGLNQAGRNIGDGISLIQTAEGGMQEIHNIMQRQRELTIQAMNDTNDDDVDRPAIQAEIDQLTAEIDDMANKTVFNDIPLLANPGETETVVTRAPADVVVVLDISISMDGELDAVKNSLGSLFNNLPEKSTVGFVFFNEVNVTPNIKVPLSSDVDELQESINKVNVVSASDTATESGLDGLADAIEMLSSGENPSKKIIYITDSDAKTSSGTGLNHSQYSIRKINEDMIGAGIEFHGCGPRGGNGRTQILDLERGTDGSTENYCDDLSGLADDTFTKTEETITYEPKPPEPLWIQSGANEGDGIWLNTYDCTAKALGVDSIAIDPLERARESLAKLDNGINTVSTYRADAGAKQNRLEHTLKNVENTAENLSAAESRIRDVDMAKEMTEYIKSDILSQAGTSILAQANQQPQGVLRLLG